MQVAGPLKPVNISIILSGSKSISNRLLLLDHQFQRGSHFQNISSSDDTLLLQKALALIKNNRSAIIDIQHAGSDLRFLTALLSVTDGEWVLTGSERMQQRPVGELVEALQTLGASIQYLEKTGFPPLKITGGKISGGEIEIDGGISSQFVSALLLISPVLQKGLTLILKNKVVSRPYIDMTIALLKEFNLTVTEEKNVIKVVAFKQPLGRFNPKPVERRIESDWSSASYWYSICALSPESRISLCFLNANSVQADAVLPFLFNEIGVETVFKDNVVELKHRRPLIKELKYDFTNCPDIAQTVAVTCFALGIKTELTGLKTLKIKETDRIVALKTELEKFGAIVNVTETSINITPFGETPTALNQRSSNEIIQLETYNDHRMAMSFAPLALVTKAINICHPEVVNKSYPNFWQDLKTAGFNLNLHP